MSSKKVKKKKKKRWTSLRPVELTLALSSAKNKYINNIIGDIKVNHRPFWKYIKSQKVNQIVPPLKNESGHLVTEDRDKADFFNSQFKQNFSHEDVTRIPFYHRSWLSYLCRNVEYYNF